MTTTQTLQCTKHFSWFDGVVQSDCTLPQHEGDHFDGLDWFNDQGRCTNLHHPKLSTRERNRIKKERLRITTEQAVRHIAEMGGFSSEVVEANWSFSGPDYLRVCMKQCERGDQKQTLRTMARVLGWDESWEPLDVVCPNPFAQPRRSRNIDWLPAGILQGTPREAPK